MKSSEASRFVFDGAHMATNNDLATVERVEPGCMSQIPRHCVVTHLLCAAWQGRVASLFIVFDAAVTRQRRGQIKGPRASKNGRVH